MFLSAGRNTGPVTRRVVLKVSSIYNKCITLPPANGMTLIRSLSIFRMFASIHKHGSFYVKELAFDDSAVFVKLDFSEVNYAGSDYSR